MKLIPAQCSATLFLPTVKRPTKQKGSVLLLPRPLSLGLSLLLSPSPSILRLPWPPPGGSSLVHNATLPFSSLLSLVRFLLSGWTSRIIWPSEERGGAEGWVRSPGQGLSGGATTSPSSSSPSCSSSTSPSASSSPASSCSCPCRSRPRSRWTDRTRGRWPSASSRTRSLAKVGDFWSKNLIFFGGRRNAGLRRSTKSVKEKFSVSLFVLSFIGTVKEPILDGFAVGFCIFSVEGCELSTRARPIFLISGFYVREKLHQISVL